MPPRPVLSAPRRIGLAAVALAALLIPHAAMAEVRFTGEARMGVVRTVPEADRPGARGDGDGTPRWEFTARSRLGVELRGTTDGGLDFGADVRIDVPDRPERR